MAGAVALVGQARRGDDGAGQRVAQPPEQRDRRGIVVVEHGGLGADTERDARGVRAGADHQVGAQPAGQGQHPRLARQELAGAPQLRAAHAGQHHVGDAEGAQQLQRHVLVAGHHRALVALGAPRGPHGAEDVGQRRMGDVDERAHYLGR
jgi:hypothetical protein